MPGLGVPVRWSAALALACAIGCAGAQARGERVLQSPAAGALPEPDPSCRATVRAPLVANGLERVTVKVGVGPDGKLTVLEFLSPDLTPAEQLELRRAFDRCVWKPSIGPDGQPRPALTTLLFESDR